MFDKGFAEFTVATVAAGLEFLEGKNYTLSVFGLCCLAHRLSLLVCFAVMSLEFAHVGAHEAHDAQLFGEGWLWVVGDQWRGFFHLFPVATGNAVSDDLHVFAQVSHYLLQGKWLARLRASYDE